MSGRTRVFVAKTKRANPALVRQWTRRQVENAFARSGYLLQKIDDDKRRYLEPTHSGEVALPAGAAEYLRPDNPRLVELRERYNALEIPAAVPTQWRDSFLRRNLSLAWFRGDNAYVWQLRLHSGAAEMRNYLSLLDVAARDRLGLLKRLKEDGLFGAFTFTFGDRDPVSRDLLDSVNEINYLEDQIGLSGIGELKVLDIGAGYGRLAHRMCEALPNLARYDCIDGVAISTFLCEYYVRFRQLPDYVRVVPLDRVDALEDSYDLAVNVHSFSECSVAAIRWWLQRLSERRVEWLLIVPNTQGALLSTELGGGHEDFMPDVLAAGYELADHRTVYASDELRPLIDLHDEFFLFRRRG
ncbi:MAG: hypothetical protein NVSMB48_21570 [Marmoricola sp.]